MFEITVNGEFVPLTKEPPNKGEDFPVLKLLNSSFKFISTKDFLGNKVIYYFIPSFFESISFVSIIKLSNYLKNIDNIHFIPISCDMPWAQEYYAHTSELDNLLCASDYPLKEAAYNLGLEMQDGVYKGFLSRCLFVVNGEGKIIYRQLVPELLEEPNYKELMANLF